LFGLTAKKGLVGRLAKGLVGLTRTKGKLDLRKLTAVGLGLSALESSKQQRQAEKAIQQAFQAQQQWWQNTLTPMTQMTNALMGYGFQFLMPWMWVPPQVPTPTQQDQQQNLPFFPFFPPIG
jgi:hypothetical protein